jgi:hypothetical protein
MNIYKLKFADKEQAIAVLKEKNVLVEQTFQEETHLAYGDGVQAVVELGLIMLTPPVMGEDMTIVTEPVYADGYHYDVMSLELYDFESYLIEPKNPKHAFAGYATTDEFSYEPNILING